jgi:hypothetical protein
MQLAIKHLFPGISDSEFALQDDGAGPYIAHWRRPEPMPTPQELAAVVVPPAVPQVVSKFQAKAALRGAGLLSQVETLMADPAADPLAVLAWTEAQEFRRSSPTVAGMAAALGLDDAALDALFTTAAGIEA